MLKIIGTDHIRYMEIGKLISLLQQAQATEARTFVAMGGIGTALLLLEPKDLNNPVEGEFVQVGIIDVSGEEINYV